MFLHLHIFPISFPYSIESTFYWQRTRESPEHADKAPTKIQLLQQSKQPLRDLSTYIKDLENAYINIQQDENEEQSNQQAINELNKKINHQERIINDLKKQKEKQDTKNVKLAQKIDARENTLSKLNKEKVSVEQNLDKLDDLLKQDIQTAKKLVEIQNEGAQKVAVNRGPIIGAFQIAKKPVGVQNESAQKVVVNRDQIIEAAQGAIKDQMKKEVASVTSLSALQSQDAVPQLNQQIGYLQSRIENLEIILRNLLNRN